MTDKNLTPLASLIEPPKSGFWGDSEPNADRKVRVNVVTNGDAQRSGSIQPEDLPTRYFSESEYQKSKLIRGDIVITTSGEPGSVARMLVDRKDVVASNFIKILKARPNVDSSWLFYMLNSSPVRKQLNSFVQHSVIANLSTDCFERVQIVEIKKAEQRAIAEVMAKIDKVIDETVSLIEKGQRIKQAMMQDLFRYGIDENGQIRTEETHKFKNSLLGRIPEDWKIGGVIDFIDPTNPIAIKPGPFGSSLKKEAYTESGYKVYGQEQVLAGDASIGNYFIDKKKYRELIAFKIAPKDVLLSMMGTVGNVLVLPDYAMDGVINPRLIKISVSPKKTDVNFFAQSLLRPETNHQLLLMASGVTMPGINKEIVLKLKFVIPTKAEQIRIMHVLNANDEMINKERCLREKLTSIKNGLLEDLLTGTTHLQYVAKK